jgi:hypothetical protein
MTKRRPDPKRDPVPQAPDQPPAGEMEYLARHNPDTITERLKEVWDSIAEPEDRFVTETAQSVLRRVEW